MGKWRSVAAVIAGGAVILAVACGGLGGPSSGSKLEIRGQVFSNFRVDIPCEEQAADESRPLELSGIELTFTDEDGDLLGTATTGPLEVEPLDYGCRFSAAYGVTLPAASRYGVEFDSPPPRELPGGGYYEGAELLEPREISHADLTEAGFEWSFEAEPAYAVP